MRLPIFSEVLPPKWLKGGHFDTVYAKALQAKRPNYRRELIADSTGKTVVAYDFVDAQKQDVPLVVLFHGLEGSSESHYSIALMNAVHQLGWHGVVAHFRGCGGVVNTAGIAYHSGDSHEIAHMLNTLKQRYQKIYAVGVSLGGNVLAKYLGEQKHQAKSDLNVIVSAPLDLMDASKKLSKGLSRRIYIPYFLRSLKPKILSEAQYHDPEIIKKVSKSKTLTEFDTYFTAPIHGFSSPEDYYRKSSAKPFLKYIQRPTLIINALNDPFMTQKALPTQEDVSPYVQLLQPKRGGHLGFVTGEGKGHIEWLPNTILTFFQHYHHQ